MRKMGVRALAALFCAGLAVSGAAASGGIDVDMPPANKSSWWPGGWFTATPKPGAGGTDKKANANKDPKDDGPSFAERTADMRAREEKAYWRRFDACLRLQEIAAQSNDAALQRQAEQLSAQAFDIYMQRTAGMVGGARFEPVDNFIEGRLPKTKAETGKLRPAGEDK
jgi:hypothetical protein